MGQCKQLLPLGETTVIGRCLDTLRCGGVNDIAVVVSKGACEVVTAVEQHSVLIVENPEGDGDMASSIRSGRDALGNVFSGVVIALCDYPLVAPATLELLLQRHWQFPGNIITPVHAGRRGHPLLFARSILNELKEGMTLRDVMRQESDRVHDLPVDDPGILIDMDTPDDYARICRMLSYP